MLENIFLGMKSRFQLKKITSRKSEIDILPSETFLLMPNSTQRLPEQDRLSPYHRGKRYTFCNGLRVTSVWSWTYILASKGIPVPSRWFNISEVGTFWRKKVSVPILPRACIRDVLRELYNSRSEGHHGILSRVRERYYWINYHQDIEWFYGCGLSAP